ncbi:TRAP transporter small permease subunit [Pseudoxanthobacter sp. M-2]|uniref:TRAP transporter small permease subunit n=1 Tax=Pseudoxanthobacter sp. M-2 TaxID=3078754 RepID=UPI0038FCC71D
MAPLLALSRAIDFVNLKIGLAARWLILVAVLISAANAIIRKAFSVSSNSWLEAQWFLFGAVFMLCASYTLMRNGHIRIDVVVSHFSKRTRDWIDVFGHVFFLLPFCLLMIVDSWPFFLRSWEQNEQSLNAGGLPLWPAKFLVPAGFFLLALQGVSELIKRIAVIRGEIPEPYESGEGAH